MVEPRGVFMNIQNRDQVKAFNFMLMPVIFKTTLCYHNTLILETYLICLVGYRHKIISRILFVEPSSNTIFFCDNDRLNFANL